LTDVSNKGALSGFGQALKKSLDTTGAQAERYLRSLIDKSIGKSKPGFRLQSGALVPNSTGLLRSAARYTGARILDKWTIDAGLFDLGLISYVGDGVNAHGYPGYSYLDLLEEGTEPFTITNPRQKKAFRFIMKATGLWDDNYVGGNDWLVPARKPYRFFQKSMDYWNDLILRRGNEFINYITNLPVGPATVERAPRGFEFVGGGRTWKHTGFLPGWDKYTVKFL
jgi:hypothetical protein